jgi:Polyketide cyclase / dehydrase and lipid transport
MRCHASASVELPLDAERAWGTVVDWDHQSDWMLLTTVRAVSQEGRGLGARLSARTAVGAVGFTDDMVITHWSPPYECRVRHLGRLVRGQGVFLVEPIGASAAPGSTAVGSTAAGSAAASRFTWSEDVVPPFGRLGEFLWPVVRPGFELFMRISLRRLARQVHAE